MYLKIEVSAGSIYTHTMNCRDLPYLRIGIPCEQIYTNIPQKVPADAASDNTGDFWKTIADIGWPVDHVTTKLYKGFAYDYVPIHLDLRKRLIDDDFEERCDDVDAIISHIIASGRDAYNTMSADFDYVQTLADNPDTYASFLAALPKDTQREITDQIL
jgi:hypothetical protein